MKPVTIRVELGPNSYPIYIGGGCLDEAKLLASHIAGRQVLIVTNETVAPLYLARLKNTLAEFHVDHLLLQDGEQYKTLDTLNLIYHALLENGHNRRTTIIALGGGVVGDSAGFAAATYQRGVAFIQIPTTLLSQVDSSVGGKTGVNHALGKNMIGAFHQPQAVFIDTECLQTLPSRELSAGLAEVIKHGALADAAYFHWLEAVMDDILFLNREALMEAVQRSCEIKARVVAEDERESGVRALLNFGHTFGHAIETGMGYGQWLHGEAVGAGMVMAADLSVRLGMMHISDGIRLKELIGRAGLPVSPPEHLAHELLGLMTRDKKVSDKGLRFVLLHGLGKAELVDEVDAETLKATLGAGVNLLA